MEGGTPRLHIIHLDTPAWLANVHTEHAHWSAADFVEVEVGLVTFTLLVTVLVKDLFRAVANSALASPLVCLLVYLTVPVLLFRCTSVSVELN